MDKVIKIIVTIIVSFLIFGIASGQVRLKDAPIVSDRPAKPEDTARIVDKDEHQRVADKLVLRIQKLENEVSRLRIEVKKLKGKIERD